MTEPLTATDVNQYMTDARNVLNQALHRKGFSLDRTILITRDGIAAWSIQDQWNKYVDCVNNLDLSNLTPSENQKVQNLLTKVTLEVVAETAYQYLAEKQEVSEYIRESLPTVKIKAIIARQAERYAKQEVEILDIPWSAKSKKGTGKTKAA